MRWASHLASGLLVGLALGSAPLVPRAPAQPGPGTAAPLDVRVTEGRVSLDVRNTSLADLLRVIGERAGVTIHLEGDLSAPVTRAFTDVPLDQAIRRLARGHSLSFAYAAPERPGAPGRLAEVWVIPTTGHPVPAARVDRRQRAVDLRAVRALASRRDPAAVAELARMLAQEADPLVRTHAAAALGRVPDPQGAAALTAALGDQAAPVRIQALRSLQRVAREQATDPVARVLAADPDPAVRRSAAWVLGGLRSPAAGSSLRAAVASDADESVRRAAAEALVRWERVR